MLRWSCCRRPLGLRDISFQPGAALAFAMRAAKPTALDGGLKLRLAHKTSVYDSVQTGRAGIVHNGDAESSISTIIRMCGNLGLSHY